MKIVSGLGALSRERLSKVLRVSKGIITVGLVSEVLNNSNIEAGKLLSYWARQGWLYRIKRGIYISVPIESSDGEPAIEDPWIIANTVFEPCYIGGWSAAEYWDFTEQIYQSICVITSESKRNKQATLGNVDFYIKTITSMKLSGLKGVWRGQVKVNISDPSRTLADMLDDLKLGGGIRPVYDILINYMKSTHKNLYLLIQYSEQIGNKSIFKRLGFLLEQYFPDEEKIISLCHQKISSGYTKLDPGLDSNKIVTRWKLRVPEYWKEKIKYDKQTGTS